MKKKRGGLAMVENILEGEKHRHLVRKGVFSNGLKGKELLCDAYGGGGGKRSESQSGKTRNMFLKGMELRKKVNIYRGLFFIGGKERRPHLVYSSPCQGAILRKGGGEGSLLFVV